MIRYVIKFTNFTSGSMAGRDDGYPYTDQRTFDDMESFLKGLKTINRIESYYAEEVSIIPKEKLDKEIASFEHHQAMVKAYRERKDKEARLEQLRKETELLEKELGRDK